MRIQVTEKHIRNGVRGSCASDPLCLALKDAGFKDPWVSPTQMTWKRGGAVHHQYTPDGLLEFMKDYDNGVVVFPFEFELEEK